MAIVPLIGTGEQRTKVPIQLQLGSCALWFLSTARRPSWDGSNSKAVVVIIV
jgi:hypothetical protein